MTDRVSFGSRVFLKYIGTFLSILLNRLVNLCFCVRKMNTGFGVFPSEGNRSMWNFRQGKPYFRDWQFTLESSQGG